MVKDVKAMSRKTGSDFSGDFEDTATPSVCVGKVASD